MQSILRDKEAFIAEAGRQLTSICEQVRAGQPPLPQDRYHTEGFIRAGIFIGLVTYQEMDELKEAIHKRIFGVSSATRKQQAHSRWQADSNDYSYYESPSYHRSIKR